MTLVTGASGNVGIGLAQILTARGIPFQAMVRSPEAARKVEGLAGAELAAGDFNDSASVARALAVIDRAFLLTPSSKLAEAQQCSVGDAVLGVRTSGRPMDMLGDPGPPATAPPARVRSIGSGPGAGTAAWRLGPAW
jgi:uncharacterized protein YbjT (DUF2867 family)